MLFELCGARSRCADHVAAVGVGDTGGGERAGFAGRWRPPEADAARRTGRAITTALVHGLELQEPSVLFSKVTVKRVVNMGDRWSVGSWSPAQRVE